MDLNKARKLTELYLIYDRVNIDSMHIRNNSMLVHNCNGHCKVIVGKGAHEISFILPNEITNEFMHLLKDFYAKKEKELQNKIENNK